MEAPRPGEEPSRVLFGPAVQSASSSFLELSARPRAREAHQEDADWILASPEAPKGALCTHPESGLRPEPLPAARGQRFNHSQALFQAVDNMETIKLFVREKAKETFIAWQQM